MKKIILSTLILCVTILSCKKEVTVTQGDGYADWTAETHSASSPDYSEVFGDSEVRRIDITIDKAYWKLMEKHLSNFYSSSGGGGGDFTEATPIYVPCNLEYNGINWYNVGIRYKGNSSLQSAYSSGISKLPLRLNFDEFSNDYPELTGQNFYGFNELSLSSSYKDQSLMREKVASDLFRDFDVPCARSVFCRVYVDFGEGSTYFGLYTMLEVVFDSMLENEFGSAYGNCYKPDGDGASFAEGSFDESYFENKTDGTDWSDVRSLYDVLHSSERTSNPASWRTSLESVLDVDQYLKYMAVNFTIQNWDTYGRMTHNYYLYNNPSDSKLNWIPWDNNEAFDEGKQGGALSIDLSDASNDWPLLSYIIADDTYESTYKVHLRNFIDNHFNSSNMSSIYNSYYSQIEPYVTGEFGEQSGYTFLNSDNDFSSALNTLISHTSSRYSVVDAYAP
ncbi:MAG: spore coat protein CotH [Crocinitomicaceae bacterium]|jgi:spore coat protein CotH